MTAFLTQKHLGISADRFELLGKPSLGAYYARDDYRSHRLLDGARCVICGRPATDAHHVVPRSTTKGVKVSTPNGPRKILSPLFALCRDCHRDIHDRSRYRVVWVWSSELARKLAKDLEPGAVEFLYYGHYEITDKQDGRVVEI